MWKHVLAFVKKFKKFTEFTPNEIHINEIWCSVNGMFFHYICRQFRIMIHVSDAPYLLEYLAKCPYPEKQMLVNVKPRNHLWYTWTQAFVEKVSATMQLFLWEGNYITEQHKPCFHDLNIPLSNCMHEWFSSLSIETLELNFPMQRPKIDHLVLHGGQVYMKSLFRALNQARCALIFKNFLYSYFKNVILFFSLSIFELLHWSMG